jgi:hypothetical protein
MRDRPKKQPVAVASGAVSPATVDCIVLTMTATGVAAVRDVAATGARMIGVDGDALAPVHACQEPTAARDLSGRLLDDQIVPALFAHAAAQPVLPVVVPASDATAQWLVAHRERPVPHVWASAAMTHETATTVRHTAMKAISHLAGRK